MPETKPTNTNTTYKANLIGRLRHKLDTFRLTRLSRRRNLPWRLPAVERAYEKERALTAAQYGNNAPCPLCDEVANRHIELETEHMRIIANDYPYHLYDGGVVKKHMMLVPRRHVQRLSDLDEQEQAQYWKLYVDLADKGYNTMTRPAGSHRRSVPGHVHTHLIDIDTN